MSDEAAAEPANAGVDPVAKGCGLGCLGLLAVFLLFVGWSVISGGNDDDEVSSYEAKAQCEGFADKRLKSPGSAEYDLSASQTGSTWTVTGTVDSENGFGALLRSNVTCKIRFVGDTAHLDDLTLTPQ